MKTCNLCKLEKPFTEFHRNKSKRSGLQDECKLCRKTRAAAWHLSNKETASKRYKSYKERKPEVIKAGLHRWYLENRDRKLAESKKPELTEWRRKHSKKIRDELADCYLYDLMRKQVGVEATPDLIEAKRLHIQIGRKLKELRA